jgi:hypothetical protein
MQKINESQEGDLLIRLMNFYKKRYTNQTEFEQKFNDAVEDLIDTGDIKKSTYVEFCIENDIEPKIKKKSSGGSSYTSSGCGGGGGYTRSHC